MRFPSIFASVDCKWFSTKSEKMRGEEEVLGSLAEVIYGPLR